MKLINNTAALFISCMFSCFTYAQRPNIVKQPPKLNGVLKATSNAAMNAKIHANSNSVFGAGNSNNKYNKKTQPKKEGIKKEEEVAANSKVKKQKNKKPAKILAAD